MKTPVLAVVWGLSLRPQIFEVPLFFFSLLHEYILGLFLELSVILMNAKKKRLTVIVNVTYSVKWSICEFKWASS